jgi:plastocyanin
MIEPLPVTMQCLFRDRTAGAGKSRAWLHAAIVTAFSILMLALSPVHAGDLDIHVIDPGGHGVAGMIVVAEPLDARFDKRMPRTVVMDQHNMQFVPSVLVIQTGSSVDFPNSDQILHQVYSFSAAKTFQLSLYAGHHYPPVLFDRPGLVTVGCNIHDQMIGYIYVTDSPWFGRTDAHGDLHLKDLSPGQYTVKAWAPGLMGADRGGLQLPVAVNGSGLADARLQLRHALRGAPPMLMDKRWADY